MMAPNEVRRTFWVTSLCTKLAEEALSNIKHILRKIAARTKELLIEAKGCALAAVSARDVRGFFINRLPCSGAATMKGAVRTEIVCSRCAQALSAPRADPYSTLE